MEENEEVSGLAWLPFCGTLTCGDDVLDSCVLCSYSLAQMQTEHNSMAIMPNVQEISKADGYGRHRRGLWNQHSMMDQLNAVLASRRQIAHVEGAVPVPANNEASAVASEISPYFRKSPEQTQYWNLNP